MSSLTKIIYESDNVLTKTFWYSKKGILNLMPLKYALKSDALGGCLVRLMDAPALRPIGYDIPFLICSQKHFICSKSKSSETS